VEFSLPKGIKAEVLDKGTRFSLTGFDKEQLGQLAANIRSIRPPDVYKGKGVRYAGEKLRKKMGKAGGR
jgi:large subunit ribosomal protein L6